LSSSPSALSTVSCTHTSPVARHRRWLFRGAYSCGEALARGEKPWLAQGHDPPYITYCMNLVRERLCEVLY